MNGLEKELTKFFRSFAEVSFIDLKRSFPNHFDKLKGKYLTKGKKVAWKGISPEMATSLEKLLSAGVVELIDVPKKRYSLEGYEVNEKDWAPMAFVFKKEIPNHAI